MEHPAHAEKFVEISRRIIRRDSLTLEFEEVRILLLSVNMPSYQIPARSNH